MPEDIIHYGTKRHSGRYPYGSGDNPYQRSLDFLGSISELKKQGLSDKEISKGFGLTTTELRAKRSLAREEVRSANSSMALRLKDKGMSNVAIGERMGINESSVRSLLEPSRIERATITKTTADMLKNNVDEKRFIDVGLGIEHHLGVKRNRVNAALQDLKEQGYKIHYLKIEQVGIPGNYTHVKVLGAPDTTYSEAYKERYNIPGVNNYSMDGGRNFLGLLPIESVSSKRVGVKYKGEGGEEKDGVIELRRGAQDISLGNSKYAQVRILVDGTHYLKGMAMYSDNLPDGVDILFNTNKNKSDNKLDAMKKISDDEENPFGATVRQKFYITNKGLSNPEISENIKNLKEKGMTNKNISDLLHIQEKDISEYVKVSALNIVNEEGDWNTWSKNLSSQMLSKQSLSLAKQQLDEKYNQYKEEYDEISKVTNSVVKKQLLLSFADGADSESVDLQAAALPRQASQVILPIPSLKDNEVYAPNFRDGEMVVLIRHPHGGIFEIPELRVNNKNKEALSVMKNAIDGIGINSNVAKRLSGADFDGDTVITIPNNRGLIKTSAPLKNLINFDPIEQYPGYEGMPEMTDKVKGLEMGKISNLITDMTIKGATNDEIARAIRHSMVVIDAKKHRLNYKQSAIDNGIANLKTKYQGKANAGASTLISKASSEIRVNERREGARIGPISKKTGLPTKLYIDPETGKKIYEETGAIKRNGRPVTQGIPRMQYYDDAKLLSSGHPMENVYAQHANRLKSLANKARKESINQPRIRYNPSVKNTYKKEVESIIAQLNDAIANKPQERLANRMANQITEMKKQQNPNMTKDELKKKAAQSLAEARARTGAKKQSINLTEKEWEAIQAGAVSNNVLLQILANTDMDRIKYLATPRANKSMSSGEISRAKSMLKSGNTRAEVAEMFGVSISTFNRLVD